jgi:hypothetical protein
MHFCTTALALAVVAASPTQNTTGHNTTAFPADFYGVDVSQPTSTAAFTCLKAANLRFAIVRCYESLGR